MKGSSIILVALFSLLSDKPVIAADAELTIAPNKCVALRKGQVCYQKLRIRFQTSEKGSFCIVTDDQVEPLKCFTNVSAGELVFPFASEAAKSFSLVNTDSVVIANGGVTVAWVYKKSRKRNRWRLF